jgi:hypothetical protein
MMPGKPAGFKQKAEAMVEELLLFASCYGVDGELVFSEAKQNAIKIAIKMIDHDLDIMRILGSTQPKLHKKLRMKEELQLMLILK